VIGVVGLALIVPGLAGCGSTQAPAAPRPTSSVPQGLRGYVVSPLLGYPLELDSTTRAELEDGYVELTQRGGREVARAVASALLAGQPDLAPALVLRAQVEVSSGGAGSADIAWSALELVIGRLPGYLAAQLLAGRVAELREDPIGAYAAYRTIADRSPLAAERSNAVREVAIQRTLRELQVALERARSDDAERWLLVLAEWAPDSREARHGELAIARALDDDARALRVLRLLAPEPGSGRDLWQQLAELELAAGAPERAIDIYGQLQRQYPSDPTLAEGMAVAQFRSRLSLMPAEKSAILKKAELTRGDFATLLYWNVPGLRSTRSSQALIIIQDLPEQHPQRTEVIRLANLQLMRLADATVRRFAPDEPIQRADAIEALLGLPEYSGVRPACLEGVSLGERRSHARVCERAVACGLIALETACLPQAPLSSDDAQDLLRRALELAHR
jgi:tetratricopeptide (TPR) repeat protein